MSFQILLQSQTADGGWICQTPESMRTLTPALPAENRLVLRSARLHPALTLCDPVRLYKIAYVCLPESLPFTPVAELVRGRRRTLGKSLPSLSEALGQEPSQASLVCTATVQTSPKSCRDCRGVLEIQVPRQVFPPKWEPQG